MIEVVPQPRIDTLVDDPAGGRRRRTEYSGVAWFGGRPQAIAAGALVVSRGSARIESPFFLPDSLPYRPEHLADATLSVTVAITSLSEYVSMFDTVANFVADPSGAPTWVQVQVLASARVPVALSYRVVALTALEAVVEA